MRKKGENPPYVIFTGTNGTGKSTKMKTFLKAQKRNLVIPANMDDSKHTWKEVTQVLEPKYRWIKTEVRPGKFKHVKEWYIPELRTFKGNAKIHLEHKELDPVDLFRAVLDFNNGYMNGGLFMDDFKNYIFSHGRLPGWISQIFRNRRHKNISIYMAAHHYSHVNAELLDFGPVLGLCRVRRSVNDAFLEKVPNQEEFLQVHRRVQARAKFNPYYCEKFEIE